MTAGKYAQNAVIYFSDYPFPDVKENERISGDLLVVIFYSQVNL